MIQDKKISSIKNKFNHTKMRLSNSTGVMLTICSFCDKSTLLSLQATNKKLYNNIVPNSINLINQEPVEQYISFQPMLPVQLTRDTEFEHLKELTCKSMNKKPDFVSQDWDNSDLNQLPQEEFKKKYNYSESAEPNTVIITIKSVIYETLIQLSKDEVAEMRSIIVQKDPPSCLNKKTSNPRLDPIIDIIKTSYDLMDINKDLCLDIIIACIVKADYIMNDKYGVDFLFQKANIQEKIVSNILEEEDAEY